MTTHEIEIGWERFKHAIPGVATSIVVCGTMLVVPSVATDPRMVAIVAIVGIAVTAGSTVASFVIDQNRSMRADIGALQSQCDHLQEKTNAFDLAVAKLQDGDSGLLRRYDDLSDRMGRAQASIKRFEQDLRVEEQIIALNRKVSALYSAYEEMKQQENRI